MASIRLTLLALIAVIYLSGGNFAFGHRMTPGRVSLLCNQYFRNVTNRGNGFGDMRYFAIQGVSLHNTLNCIDQRFETFRNMTCPPITKKINPSAALLGACKAARSYAITSDLLSNSNISFNSPAAQATMFVDLSRFVNEVLCQIKDSKKRIQAGFAYGEQIANIIISQQAGDGFDAIVPPQMGVWPYQPGQWYSASSIDGFTYPPPPGNVANDGALYPQWGSIQPMGIPNSAHIHCPPRPDYGTDEMKANVDTTYWAGNFTNPFKIRSDLDHKDAITMASGPSHLFSNTMIEQIILNNKFTNHEIVYLYAQQTLTSHDAFVHNLYWKKHYNADRPVQIIHNGGGSTYPQYVADPQWRFLRNGAHTPEYPAGHPEVSAAGTEAILQSLIKIGSVAPGSDLIPGGPISPQLLPTFSFAPVPLLTATDTMTVSHFHDFSDRVVRARVYGGMHYQVSGLVGRAIGEQLAQYNVATHMRPL